MPLLTRLLIKTSFVYLFLGLMLGILLVIQREGLPSAAGLFPIYFHLLAIGWLSSLIFGIGYWMFPNFSLEKPRGCETLGWAVFILMNAGLLPRAVAEPLSRRYPGGVRGWLLLVSAVLQWMAGLSFVINSWGRIKER